MAKKPTKKADKSLPEVEAEEGAWERFKTAVRMMAKPRKPRATKSKTKKRGK